MGKVIFIIISIVFLIGVIRAKDEKKLAWLFAAILFLPHQILVFENPFDLSALNLLVFALTIQILLHPDFKNVLINFPIKKALLIIFLSFVCIALFDTNGITILQKIWRLFTIFPSQIFIVFITYFYTKSVKGFFSQYNFLIRLFFIFCVYGFANYFTHTNAFNDFIARTYGTKDVVNLAMSFDVDRFRISSFTDNPILYGLYLSIIILITFFLFYFFKPRGYVKFLYLGMLLLLFINLILVDTRTPVAALIIGLIVFIIWGLNARQRIRLFSISVILLAGLFFYSSGKSNILTETYDTFSGKKTNIEGSSFSMRQTQLDGAIKVFLQKPITGNGFYYASNILPYIVVPHFDSADFFGLESYAYRMLIEEGAVGILGNIIFFGALFGFYLRSIKRSGETGKRISLLGICLLLIYLFFIFGTGDLDSFPFFMALMGVTIKGVLLSSSSDKSIIKNKKYQAA